MVKSKQEIYSILLTQGQYYLPQYNECTIEFLRDTFHGRKNLLFTHEVRMINVPRMTELAVTNLLESIKRDPTVRSYLPDLNEKKTLNREYLYNVINTLKPEFFPENIRAGLEKRKELKSMGQDKYVEIKSDIYELFQNSINLNPNQRGRAVHLLNVGAKKRKRPERNDNQFKAPTYQLSQYIAPNNFPELASATQKGKRFKTDHGVKQGQSIPGLNQSKSLNQRQNESASSSQKKVITQSMIQPQYRQSNQ